MAHWGTDLDALRRLRRAHLDIDTSVLPVHGAHEGALPGYNPRFHGRPSYHPLVARWAELDTCMAALLRPGDTYPFTGRSVIDRADGHSAGIDVELIA